MKWLQALFEPKPKVILGLCPICRSEGYAVMVDETGLTFTFRYGFTRWYRGRAECDYCGYGENHEEIE